MLQKYLQLIYFHKGENEHVLSFSLHHNQSLWRCFSPKSFS